MKKVLLVWQIFLIFFVFGCAAQTIPEPKIHFVPEYSIFPINLDEQQTLKIALTNNLNISDIFYMELAGTAFDVANIKVQPLPNVSCSTQTKCNINIKPGQEFPLYLTVFAKKVGDSSLIVHVLSKQSGLESKKSIRVIVQTKTGRGIFNAPGITWSFLILIGLAGSLIYAKRR